jgi:hypothetical protein
MTELQQHNAITTGTDVIDGEKITSDYVSVSKASFYDGDLGALNATNFHWLF